MKITFLFLHLFWSLEAFSSEVTPAIDQDDQNLQQITSLSQLSDVKESDSELGLLFNFDICSHPQPTTDYRTFFTN